MSFLFVGLIVLFNAGTCKTSEPYKIRDKTVDVQLEVLNLDKKETISIDSISNQDFCEVI